jgi:aspartyl-tRNA(Asn)/glutamyl-tRNA(Gln) amidotransferase subunit A
MTDLADLTAADLSRHFAERTLSPVEVAKAVLARIEAFEPHLAALWALDAETALADATASEARWREGNAFSALDGVPVTIKELIATRGLAKPLGSAATDLVPELVDAPPAARLREGGAVILAKTTTPDFGMLSSGLSSFHKLSRNPWDLSKTPGGSSAGAGTAAAAGYGPIHIGTDIGGSIRLPAGWCGIYGLKPSNGRIPIDPPYIGRCAGPMTRTVEDAALAMALLVAPDWRDHMSLPPATIAWQALDLDLKGLRIGLMLDAGVGAPIEPEVAQAVNRRRLGLRGGRRDRRALRALPDPRDAGWPGPLLAHAFAERPANPAAKSGGARPALHSGLGSRRRGCGRLGGLSRLQPDPADA